MGLYSPISTQSLLSLLTLSLLSTAHLSAALQVTPNSPCSSACQDSASLDASDPKSSNTRNSDITCEDAAYSSAAGTKFKTCMTCLQNSTFSHGSESDTMWFLYNLRYTAAYCILGFPNATNYGSNPCATSRACGSLEASLEDGIPDPRNMTAYSYCSAGGGAAMAASNFDMCLPCISAPGTTSYLANYLIAIEAGCRQKPASGVVLGLSDSVFSSTQISIVDPATLGKDNGAKTSLTTPAIVGIAVGAVAVLLIIAAITFVCLRKRKNKRYRNSAEADFYSKINYRHRSSMSFQCQTHMVSPRFWPGAEEGVSTPAVETPNTHAYRSSIAKPHGADYPHSPDDSITPYAADRKAALATAPLHISTTVPPTPPPQAHTTSPSSAWGGSSAGVYHSPSDFRSPLSADSARSTSALLPRSSSIRPYVPADHGVHVPSSPPFDSTSPTSASAAQHSNNNGTGMTPLLKSGVWSSLAGPQEHQQQQLGGGKGEKPAAKRIIRLSNPVPPPPPPPLKTSRSSGLLGGGEKKSPRNMGQGSPVESWEIQTAFAAPPKR